MTADTHPKWDLNGKAAAWWTLKDECWFHVLATRARYQSRAGRRRVRTAQRTTHSGE